jgi:hypothetical protein
MIFILAYGTLAILPMPSTWKADSTRVEVKAMVLLRQVIDIGDMPGRGTL